MPTPPTGPFTSRCPEYAHLTPLGEQDRGGVPATKNVRRDLKNAFPGIQFSVKSSYDNITVVLAGWPDPQRVEAVIGKHEKRQIRRHDRLFQLRHHRLMRCSAAAVIPSSSASTATGDGSSNRYLEQRSDERSDRRCKPAHLGSGQCLLTREANKVTLVGGVWHRRGHCLAGGPQALAVVAPVAAVKPKFTAKPVGHSGTSLSSRASSATSSTIAADSMGKACRIAWAMLTQPTPPEDDPDGGQPVPVAPITELITQTAQGRGPPLPEQIPGQVCRPRRHQRERLQVWAINASRASEARFNHGMGI